MIEEINSKEELAPIRIKLDVDNQNFEDVFLWNIKGIKK